MRITRLLSVTLILAALATPPGPPPAHAAPCQNTQDFKAWLAEFRREAEAEGISHKAVAAGLDGLTLDPGIIARDRKQSFFWQDFLQFSGRLATANRVVSGGRQVTKNRALFDRVEQEYGVPAPVITAFWALESDYGAVMGQLPVLRCLATLAYDCRRGPRFRAELKDALRLVERGDLAPAQMIGSWAGELGQTQFLPSHYYRYGVDYDKDGRRDLLHSAPDVIATTAAFLAAQGWKRGEPWLEEVRVPARMAWEECDLAAPHPRAHWVAAGVTRADGAALTSDTLPASLLLPMGRNGPAFLAYPNFGVYLKWNDSMNYALTAAYLATRIGGAPALRRGNGPIEPFGYDQLKQLQAALIRAGYAIGDADGKLGALTQGAVRQAQVKLGLPADGYPTPELLARLTAR